jgi:non-ribosomal peptide synthetase component F
MRETVKAFSRAEGKTLFMTLFATLLVLFYRYSGQTDICVGTVVMNRNRQELESMLGFLINTLALRMSLTGKPTFRELLERVKIVVLEALEYQELPFEMLVKELNPERSLARHPLFQISFNLDDGISPELELLGTEVERLEFHTGTTKFDLSLTIVDRTPEMKLRIEYNNGLFSPQMIDRMAGQFRNLLEGMIANPDNPISLLPLLTHVEQVQILKEGDLGRADLNEIESKYDGQQSSNYEAKPEQLPSPDAGERFLTPRTSVEQVLARIWKEILNSGRLGAQDNFFDLGGNSLLALRLVSKLQDVLQINLPVRMVFEWPTLGELTQVVLSISEDAERTENMAQIVLWVADLSDEQAIKLLTGKKPD